MALVEVLDDVEYHPGVLIEQHEAAAAQRSYRMKPSVTGDLYMI